MAFPKSARTTAWEAAMAILRADPVLKNNVKTFRYWSGDPKDIEGPSEGQYPYLKVTPHPADMGFVTNQHHEASFLLDVELALDGTRAGDLMDFWESVERAFYPKSLATFNVIQERLKDVGIQDVEFLKAGWDVKNTGGQPLSGKGQIKLKFFSRNKGIQS